MDAKTFKISLKEETSDVTQDALFPTLTEDNELLLAIGKFLKFIYFNNNAFEHIPCTTVVYGANYNFIMHLFSKDRAFDVYDHKEELRAMVPVKGRI